MVKSLLSTVLILILVLVFGCGNKEQAPAPNIVATLDGEQITRKELDDYIKTRVRAVDPEAEEQIHRKEVYRQVVQKMTLDLMVKKKITEKKLDKKKNIKHVMKHLSEDMNIDELHSQAHERKIKVSETDIKKYYEDNRDQYADDRLTEVKEEIREILLSKSEKEYFKNYMEELKKNAIITREYRLLKIPEPTEADLRIYYEENRKTYGSPEKPFSEVKGQIMKSVRKEKEEKWFEENRNSTLFTIHGKRYSLGEFYQELKELPPAERKKYYNYETLKELVDRMIERMLVVEDTYDQMLGAETKEELKDVREDILRELLHQEEVDDKVEISDEEIKTYYETHRGEFVEPPQVKISYIRIDLGRTETEDEKKRVENKVEEAYRKLNPGFFKKGEPFEKVALEYSEDPKTAKKGGQIDEWISESNNLVEEISSHVFHQNVLGLKPGEISSPFYFHGSFYIVKVRERKEPRPLPLEQAHEQIKDELSAIKHEELTRKMGQTLLENTNLVIYDDVIESMLEDNKKRRLAGVRK